MASDSSGRLQSSEGHGQHNLKLYSKRHEGRNTAHVGSQNRSNQSRVGGSDSRGGFLEVPSEGHVLRDYVMLVRPPPSLALSPPPPPLCIVMCQPLRS